MAINFPNTPTNGQKYVDPNGISWVYETSTNSWTSGGVLGTGMVYKGGLDITAAPPTGAASGWVYSVTTGGTADAGFTGLTGNIPVGSQVIFDGTNWQQLSGSSAPASETLAGIVELATAAETTTGTDTTRAVHPAGLKVELDKKANQATTYTKTETDAALALKVNKAGDTMTGNLTVPSLNDGQLAGTRNRIINGSMDVSQRGTVFANAGGYTLDRWYVGRAGGASGLTVNQVYGAYGTKKNWIGLQRDSGNTSTAAGSMYQPIEGINCRDLAGSTVTVSFTIATGSTLSSTSNNAAIYLYYQTTSTDTGLTGAWTAVGSSLFSIASSTGPTRYTASFSVPSTATQLMTEIRVDFAGTAGADDHYYITEVQLEPGTVATPFERRNYGQELALCYRYYEIGETQLIATSQAGSPFGTTAAFKVTKRAVPTMNFSSTTLSNSTNIHSDSASIHYANVASTASITGTVSMTTGYAASAEL